MDTADMRAVVMRGAGGPDVLRVESVPKPSPGPGEVRIAVYAAAINPIDWKQRIGGFRPGVILEDPAAPRILGFDAAGVIDAVGPAVTDWQVGNPVIAALHRATQGAYAEYAVVPAEDIASKPDSVGFVEAAGLPTVATTAQRFLTDVAQFKSGDRILIQGGAGGVGSAAVQIAKAGGAYVITTASARNHEYLKSLGADEVVDYRTTNFEDVVSNVDLVLDTVGGETLTRSVAVVRRGGTLVSTAGKPPQEACAAAGVLCPDPGPPPQVPFGAALAELAALAESGQLSINVDRTFPLEAAAEAQELNREGHTRGKIILVIRE